MRLMLRPFASRPLVLGTYARIFAMAAAALAVVAIGPRQLPMAFGQGTVETYKLLDTWTTRSPQGNVPLFTDPFGLDVAADDTIYVVDRQGNAVYHLAKDGTTLQKWTPTSSVGQPLDVTALPDRVAVVGKDGGELRSLTGQFIKTFPLTSGTQGVAGGADGRFYVSRRTAGPGTMAVIDLFANDGTKTGTWQDITITIQVAYALDVAPDNRVYLAADGVVYAYENGRIVAQLRVNPPADEGPDILDVTIKANRLFGIQRGKIYAWDITTPPRGTLRSMASGALTDEARSVSVGPGGGMLISTGQTAFRGLSYLTDRAVLGGAWTHWGQADNTLGRIVAPRRLATSSAGDVFILDYSGVPAGDRIQRWTAAGNPADQWPTTGPQDVAGGGTEPCAMTGSSLTCIGPLHTTRFVANAASTSWYVDTDGNATRVGVVDLADQQLLLFDRSGSGQPLLKTSIAPSGTFVALADIAMDVQYAYLANRSTRRIDVRRLSDGGLNGSINTVPGGPIRLSAAAGALFALSPEGWIFKLSLPAGAITAAWQPISDAVPSDIAASPDGKVYVADPRRNRILVYGPGGPPAGAIPQVVGTSCEIALDRLVPPQPFCPGKPFDVSLVVGGKCPLGDGRVDVLMVLDQSGSMSGLAIAALQAAALTFVGELNPAGAQVGIVPFSTNAVVLQPLSSDLRGSVRAISKLTSGGQTNYVDGLTKALDEIKGPKRRSDAALAVIFMSDGKPTTRPGIDELVAQVKNTGATIFTVGFGEDVDADLLRTMASSADLFFAAPTESDLVDVYSEIVKRITSPRILRTGFITETIPAGFTLVPGSDVPKAKVSGQTLTWTLRDTKASGIRLNYKLKATNRGTQNVDGGQITYTDVQGQTATKPFPSGEVDVSGACTALAYLPIAYASKCQPRPVDLVFVLDSSTSMLEPARPGSGQTKFAAAVQAGQEFLNAMNFSTDQAAVVSFNTNATLVEALTNSKTNLGFALQNLELAQGSRIDRALAVAASELSSRRIRITNNPVVLLLSDGLPTGGSEAATLQQASALRRSGVSIYAVGIGDDVNAGFLTQLSSQKQRTFLAPDATKLTAIYKQIAGIALCE